MTECRINEQTFRNSRPLDNMFALGEKFSTTQNLTFDLHTEY